MNRNCNLQCIALLIAMATCGLGTAQTIPVGSEFLTAQPGNFSLFGIRFHNSSVVGNLDISGTTLYDADTNFDTALDPPPARYLIEITSGISDGKVIEIVSFAVNTLIVAESLPIETDVTYRIRPIPKLSEIISPVEPLATDDFNPDNADLILLPTGDGKFSQYYVSFHSSALHPEYFNTYINVATGLPEDPFLIYTDAFFYLRRDSSDFNLDVVGEIKLTNTLLSVTDTFNYFSSVYPIGETLANSNLSVSLQAGTAATADLIWIQDGSGNYRTYFLSDGTSQLTAGWRLANADPGLEDVDQSEVELSAGFIIQRRAPAPYNTLLTPPDYYGSL